jgi:hypothetical protein
LFSFEIISTQEYPGVNKKSLQTEHLFADAGALAFVNAKTARDGFVDTAGLIHRNRSANRRGHNGRAKLLC